MFTRSRALKMYRYRTASHAYIKFCVSLAVLSLPRCAARLSWSFGVLIFAALTPACSLPLSVALRPRVAVRSPMCGASWRPTRAGECGREAIIQSRRSCGVSNCHNRTDSSSPTSVAPHPRIAARSAMSGVSWWATRRRGCADERARPLSPRSRRTLRSRVRTKHGNEETPGPGCEGVGAAAQ
jgi:hypothetical protein